MPTASTLRNLLPAVPEGLHANGHGTKCRLTPRSRGDPPRLAALPDRPRVSVGLSGKAASRSGRVSSNVRRHETRPCALRSSENSQFMWLQGGAAELRDQARARWLNAAHSAASRGGVCPDPSPNIPGRNAASCDWQLESSSWHPGLWQPVQYRAWTRGPIAGAAPPASHLCMSGLAPATVAEPRARRQGSPRLTARSVAAPAEYRPCQ